MSPLTVASPAVPLGVTVATSVLSMLQVTALLLALAGSTRAFRVFSSPSQRVRLAGSIATPATGTLAASLVTDTFIVSVTTSLLSVLLTSVAVTT